MTGEAERIVISVHQLLIRKRYTLSVAESCTGGLISDLITSVPGASSFFLGGVVAYSAGMKGKVLGLDMRLIKQSGVVSSETACAMAEGIRLLSGSDYSIATTGNLGPDVLEGRERGLVFVAVSREGKTVSKELHLHGGRLENKEAAALQALTLLVESAGGRTLTEDQS